MLIKYKIFFIFLIIISFAFLLIGCGDVEEEIQDIYTQNYVENNSNEPQESVKNVEQQIQKKPANHEDSPDTSKSNVSKLQVPDGYAALCGIWTSGNGASITGNVKIYGGVYTRGILLLGNGAVINTDNGYLYKLDTTPNNNPVIFESIVNKKMKDEEKKYYTQYNKPFKIENVPKNVRLINVSEEELTQSEMAEIMKP